MILASILIIPDDTLKPFAYKCDVARYCIMHADRQPAGSFQDFGFSGANWYGDMWKAGDIYNARARP